MGKLIRMSMLAGIAVALAIPAAGCGRIGGPRPGATAHTRPAIADKLVERPKAPYTGLGSDNPVTGSHAWSTGRATQPQPKALEEVKEYKGKVAAANAGSVTINLDNGGSKTFTVEETTQIFRSGDPRFFAIPGGAASLNEGVTVTVIAFSKGGQDYARTISVGTRGFGINNNNNDNDN
jgi:hypothetical protein